jgi:HEAT repeats
MKSLVFMLVAGAALAQSPAPGVTNSKFESRAFSGSLDTQIQGAGPAWLGYAIKTARRDHQGCCLNNSDYGCHIEGNSATVSGAPRSNTPIPLEGTDMLAVLFRFENNRVEKVHVYSLDCPLDAGGLPFLWLTGVPAATSLAFLEKLIASPTTDHRLDGALFAISQHDDPQALDLLVRLAKSDASPHTRSQAIFWLSQKAGQKAASTIEGAIENDPDTGVKKRAVFALSQLPKDEAVPKLIEIARNQKNPEVRKQAFFWLGQTHDPRALVFFEQVLAK